MKLNAVASAALLLLFLVHASYAHNSNWAVIVAGSRYWYNYRHVSNALTFYHIVKEHGIPDSQIILMLADEYACNTRNPLRGRIFNSKPARPGEKPRINLYGETAEIDYRGLDCSVNNLLRVLTGRHDPDTPASKRLNTDSESNILVYMSGHGGDQFLKFHDQDEIQSQDLADAFSIMHRQGRYNEILMMVDTCQAATMCTALKAPNTVCIGSSEKGQNSFSHVNSRDIGVAVIDRFTYYTLDFFERGLNGNRGKLSSLLNSYQPYKLRSNARTQLSRQLDRSYDSMKVTDFFGSVTEVEICTQAYPVIPVGEENTPESESPFSYPSTAHLIGRPKNQEREGINLPLLGFVTFVLFGIYQVK